MDYFTWNIDPDLIALGPLRIRWYGLMFAAGFILGFHIMKKIYLREAKRIEDLDSLLWYLVGGTVIGARLGHCLFYDPAYYFSNPIKFIAIWEGGLASHGGAIGVLTGLWLYCRKTGDNYLWLLDRIAVPTALAACFIRLGNFFNSEIVGHQTDVPWAVIFSRIKEPPTPRHPAQMYESLSYLAVFALLMLLYSQKG